MLPAAEIRRFRNSATGLAYLDERTRDAEISIDYATIDVRPRSPEKEAKGQYQKHRTEVIKCGQIRYRYLFRANDEQIGKVKAWLGSFSKRNFFAAGFAPSEQNIPVLFFAIVDGKEVFDRSPYETGGNEVYVSMTHPGIAALFSQWFECLWAKATKIDPRWPYEK